MRWWLALTHAGAIFSKETVETAGELLIQQT